MQSVRAKATISVGIRIDICSSGSICCSIPGISVTSGICVAVVCTLENGQKQRVHIVAAGTRLAVVVGVCSRCRVTGAVPIVVLACSNMIGHVAVIANG